MARFASQLSASGPVVLLLGLPLLMGGAILAWIVQDQQPNSRALSKSLVDELLDQQSSHQSAAAGASAAAQELAVPPLGAQAALAIRVVLHHASGPASIHRGERSETLNCRGGQLTGAPQPLGSGRWFQAVAGEPVGLNQQRYRGGVQVLCQGNKLLVVNHVPLEDYISSVVGAEMPSHWPAEALRAQAVAARSYAMAHLARPASQAWNLGATTRWQAYGGLGTESKSSRAAAADTQGLILSFEGGIVESLYAADRQLTVEAHGHLGASMSQQGARSLADKGYQFPQILSKYYPGASLARLQRS